MSTGLDLGEPTGAPMPPPPGTPSPAPAPSNESEFVWWKRTLAILGVICAFPFFLTIPGWIALRRYRDWRRGEKPAPHGLMVWGAVMTVAFVALMVSTALTPPPANSVADGTVPGSADPPEIAPFDPLPEYEEPGPLSLGIPVVGECGRETPKHIAWKDGECDPADDLIVLSVVRVKARRPFDPRRSEVRRSAATCPAKMVFYTQHTSLVACWGRR